MKSFWTLVLVFGLSVGFQPLMSKPTTDAEVIDQSFTPDNSDWIGLGRFDSRYPAIEAAQTFVVGISGFLSAFDVQVFGRPGGDGFIYEVRSLSSEGFPTGSILTQGAVDGGRLSTTATALHVELADPFPVSAGQSLGITIRCAEFGDVAWIRELGYAGGEAFGRGGVAFSPWGRLNDDFGFSTYVSQVPEPRFIVITLVASMFWLARRFVL